jgi:hypothetical protein
MMNNADHICGILKRSHAFTHVIILLAQYSGSKIASGGIIITDLYDLLQQQFIHQLNASDMCYSQF